MTRIQQFIKFVRRGAAKPRYQSETLIRTLRAAGLVLAVFLIGTVGFYTLTDGSHTLLECAYMTVITLTTVGFHEVIPVSGRPAMQAFTIVLIVLGMGGALYFASSLTAFIVDGELRNLLQLRRMEREIRQLQNHYIVAGVGKTGEYVLNEILDSRKSCVVVENDRDRIEEVAEDLDREFPYLIGDAMDDDLLEEAGIHRAEAIICSLGSDRDNLFATITARRLNEDLTIITRGYHPNAEQKFKMAGADSVIFTNVISGMRMAAEAIRPQVTTFLDLMMKDRDHYRRVEELRIPDDSPLIGHQLRESSIRQKTDALIIAVYDCDEDEYIFNPGPDYTLTAGTKLIVLTLVKDIDRIEQLLRDGTG
ncbi:MAG: TrkA family potassium uptake protein [Bradymonadaceae bacterium]